MSNLRSLSGSTSYLLAICALAAAFCWSRLSVGAEVEFDERFPNLDSQSVGEWWKWQEQHPKRKPIVDMQVPRDEVVAFALYTHQNGTLKLTAQLFPLMPDEARIARLEVFRDEQWQEIAKSPVEYPGWDAHFRIENWDNQTSARYRVRHGKNAAFEGTIRKDPVEKNEIVVASLSCNSSRTKGPREQIIANLLAQDPDLCFFAGDQTYHHTEHTAGWLEWGLQFRDIIRDRPTITIPDDHDVGQANLWGESGIEASTPQGPSGGYYYPASYVNMVQRQQTWHLPDAFDPTPIERGITVYYTNLLLGGIDFAILEDRKFKSGPEGKIPPMGPRPDHINDPSYDRDAIDLPELVLLGERQHQFIEHWTKDWSGADLKVALSQTAFCGAVHMHGKIDDRLLADLDCNGWPQAGRNEALRLIRQAWATHLCGDQHLAVVVKHGIDSPGDGPFAFTSPALVNTIYGRWWHPEDESPGTNPRTDTDLPWTGDYQDGLGNHIRMLAYANPTDVSNELERADGYGLARFNKSARTVTFECWPRFAKVADGDSAQFPGWPMTVSLDQNDGRVAVGETQVESWTTIASESLGANPISDRLPVISVRNRKTGECLYTLRVPSDNFAAPLYSRDEHEFTIGWDQPQQTVSNARAAIRWFE